VLKQLWKKQAEKSRKAFLRGDSYCYDVNIKFCNFMDHEIRVHNGKLIEDEKNGWKPRFVLRTFDEFSDVNYSPIIEAREEAEAKARQAKSGSRGA